MVIDLTHLIPGSLSALLLQRQNLSELQGVCCRGHTEHTTDTQQVLFQQRRQAQSFGMKNIMSSLSIYIINYTGILNKFRFNGYCAEIYS